eukprot:TRINITY_DN110983_c0_g1_i1.p1 TRINITY_DN110983_c0_g1~~TRINITY_DN110983_c0_g1_i1.p1  ORF type:complete len:288 (-),score=73.32 TRINITY_DN110983_c0_g1_i1:3-800(-)
MNMPGVTSGQGNSQQARSEFLEAPLRMQAESYEGFTSRLSSLSREQGSGTSVEEELRKLQIDPEVFYRKNQRLQVAEFSADTLDPSAMPAMSSARAEEETANLHDAQALQDAEFDPPPRVSAKASSEEADRTLAGLNIPSTEEVEDMPYEEIQLTGESETRGGRLGHATPKDLSARLQVDSLTDDGDEDDDFRRDVLEAPAADEEDAIEAFSLDPDFDYDNEAGLTSKVTEPERCALGKQGEVRRGQAEETDHEDDAAEDAVVEN